LKTKQRSFGTEWCDWLHIVGEITQLNFAAMSYVAKIQRPKSERVGDNVPPLPCLITTPQVKLEAKTSLTRWCDEHMVKQGFSWGDSLWSLQIWHCNSSSKLPLKEWARSHFEGD